MKLTRHFIIVPGGELKARISNAIATELSDISEEVFWTGDYYDRGSLSIEDLSEVAKLMFLNRLRRLRGGDRGFNEVFPDFSVTQGYFDRNWSLRCVELETTIEEELEEAYSTGELGAVSSDNQRINEMLTNYRPRSASKK